MGTYSADPNLLHTLSASTEACADDVDIWGAAACGVMSSHGYGSSSSSAAGAIAACSAWARSWATSLVERASLLERDRRVPLGLQRAEGLVGLFDEGAHFALNGTSPMTFAAWQQQQLEAEPGRPEELDDIARLEAELEALYEAARNGAGYGVVHAIQLVAQRLEQARIDRLNEAHGLLVALESIPASSRGYLQDTIDGLREELLDLAQALDLEPEAFALAAAAMLDGISPDDAGIAAIYFPPWYVERHDLHADLEGQAAAAEEAMWLAFDELTALSWSGDWEAQQAAQDRFNALQDTWKALDDRLDDLEDRMAVSLADATAYLDRLPLVTDDVGQSLVGEFLATQVNEHSWDNVELEAIGQVVGWYVDEPGEAVALFNALGEDAMLDIAALGTEWSNPNAGLEAFATALAMASGEVGLEIGGADLVRAPISVNWFMYGDYDPRFLVEAAGAAIQADEIFLHFSGMGVIQLPDGVEMTNGIREVLLHLVAADGPDTALAFIEHASAAGVLGALVAPDNDYLDDGGAAGAVIALIGTIDDDAAAHAMIAVMTILAADGGEAGVLNGAALMIAPHLASLVDDIKEHPLDQTALRDALDTVAGEDELVRNFLETILVDPTAAANVQLALAYLIGFELAQDFDVTDPDSLDAPVRSLNNLLALVADAHLDGNLDAAEALDAANAFKQSVISMGVDLVTAGVIAAALVTAGPSGGTSLLVAEAVGEIVGAGVTNLLIPAVTDFGLSTDNVENVLDQGYDDAAIANLSARLLIAQLLDEAGVIDIPADWTTGPLGEPPLGSWDTFSAEWDAFIIEIELNSDFSWTPWENLAEALTGGNGQVFPGDSIDGGD